MLKELKEQVCRANCDLEKFGLVRLTFGNVSALLRERGFVAIKPSGIPYRDLTPEHIVVLDLDGKTVQGNLHPSSDAPTHLTLYRAFPEIGGITHTHSTYATMFAQAGRGIPCFGTTHADVFHGEVPCTRNINEDEVRHEYEVNTGKLIIERFAEMKPLEMPGVLVACHGPFTWGKTATASVENSVVLEEIAHTAFGTMQLNPSAPPIPRYLLDKHFLRKHGTDAYYGQQR